MFAFILRADLTSLEQMFDRYLNRPSHGAVSVVPAGSLIVLNFTTLGQVSAMKGPDRQLGYFKEAEVAIWTLGFDRCRNQLATFVPYMIVDQGSAMAMGREVFGFPKQLGTVKVLDATSASPFEVSVQGVTEFGPEQLFRLQPLIVIDGRGWDRDIDHLTPDSAFELVTALWKVLEEDKPSPADLGGDGLRGALVGSGKVLDMVLSQALPMLFLKQIRDGQEPERACYRAIQLATFTVTGFRGAGVLPGVWSVTLSNLANEAISRDLGLKDGIVTPLAAFWVDFDFDLSVTEPLWSSNAQSIKVSI
jgi:hypothetical protein